MKKIAVFVRRTINLIKFHESWIFVILLINWSFHSRYNFESNFKELLYPSFWSMFGTVGFIISILIHQAGHITVASLTGILELKRVVLPLGEKVTRKSRINTPEIELTYSLAGPLFSLITASIWHTIFLISKRLSGSDTLLQSLEFLTTINVIIGGINLLPAFPLDGGTIMLTVLTSLKMKRQAAFKAITYCGYVLSMFSICAGSVLIFKESIQNGLWWIIAGLHLLEGNRFINTANILNNNLKGETVADYMRPNPLTVPLHTPLREFILEYYYRYKLGIFPVLDSGKVEGFITLAKIRGIKECDWNGYTVADFTEPCTEKNTITPSNDIMDALSMMYRQSTSHLLVLQYGELAGVLSSKDLVKFLELKIDLVTK